MVCFVLVIKIFFFLSLFRIFQSKTFHLRPVPSTSNDSRGRPDISTSNDFRTQPDPSTSNDSQTQPYLSTFNDSRAHPDPTTDIKHQPENFAVKHVQTRVIQGWVTHLESFYAENPKRTIL